MAWMKSSTTQTAGEVYAMHFIYSGNFIAQLEKASLTVSVQSWEFIRQIFPGNWKVKNHLYTGSCPYIFRRGTWKNDP